MIFDSHIHMYTELYAGKQDAPENFLKKCQAANIGGGCIFSIPPANDLSYYGTTPPTNKERTHAVLDFCAKLPDTFCPFYWIDPTEPDAEEQVQYAAEQGIRGFKVICGNHYPEEGLKTYAKCAEVGLPVTFHSGILWDGKVSSFYNRPLSFECLLSVKKLRFALAHISWPWTSECIALFGKFNAAQQYYGNAPEMYIDCSPGAPEFDREEAFKKIGLGTYGLGSRIMYGSDMNTNNFNSDFAKETYEFDQEKFEHLHSIYSDPVQVKRDLKFLRNGRETIDFRDIFHKMTEENYKSFIRKG